MLYYSPGACSMGSHIGLEEAGAAYEPHRILTSKGEQHTPEYKKINLRCKVPALKLDDGSVLTENTAILAWVGKRFPERKLLPEDDQRFARAVSHMAWLSHSAHPCFMHVVRPERFAADESAHPAVKEAGRKSFWTALQEIDGLLAGKKWVMGSQFTVADGYTLVFYGWGKRIELPVHELKNATPWKDRMLGRSAVKKVLERENSLLLQ